MAKGLGKRLVCLVGELGWAVHWAAHTAIERAMKNTEQCQGRHPADKWTFLTTIISHESTINHSPVVSGLHKAHDAKETRMSDYVSGRLHRSDWPLIFLSLLVLLVYLYYTLTFVFFTPYSGVFYTPVTNGWRIDDSFQSGLDVNDLLVQIGDLSFGEYQADRLRAPFAGYEPGESVQVVVQPGDRVVEIQMPFPAVENRLRRLLFTAWFFPFWVAGTAILLFLRPRDRRWRLLVAVMYTTAIWVMAGIVSPWRIGASRLVLGAFTWLMAPVFLHLHLVVPTPLLHHRRRYLLVFLYTVAAVLATLEFMQMLPTNAPLVSLLVATGGSITLLLYRFLSRRSSASERLASRLMLAGIGLAFGPGVALQILPQLLRVPVSGALALSVSYIAIPLLPLFYVYAVYKRQLGPLEFRANRLLSLYSFILLYPPAFLLLFLLGAQITTGGDRTIYMWLVSIAFVLAAPPLLTRFQNWLKRLAYGTEHDPDDIIRVFADQVPSVLSRQALVELLTQEILPSLLIRQSTLYLFREAEVVALYTQSVDPKGHPQDKQQIQPFLDRPRRYRPPSVDEGWWFDWVRLAIPLTTREETSGIWLLGRRDPDDFYPQDDIDLLQSLANQIAPVIENIRMYEALQQQADRLAEEVEERTAELKAERDRTQAILDSAGESIFFTDRQGQILYINPAMTVLTGYTVTETLGQTLDLWRNETTSPETYEQIWTAIREGLGWSGELTQSRRDGSRYDVNLTLAPIKTADGQVSGFVGVESDISKLKDVDRLKSNIIANVSHELKTPLTNIKMYLTLLERGRARKWKDYLSVLDHESTRLTNLIQSMLDLSQLDAGHLITHFEPTKVDVLVEKVYSTCVVRAESEQISLQMEIPSDLPTAIADAAQIEQVLTNLVVNAVNYTPPGGVVTMSAGTGQVEEKPAVWLRVSDTGCGIATEDLPHIFERFFRGQASQNSETSGTGLGLAISKEIVERHQGKIEVESEVGRGTAFTLWLLAAN